MMEGDSSSLTSKFGAAPPLPYAALVVMLLLYPSAEALAAFVAPVKPCRSRARLARFTPVDAPKTPRQSRLDEPSPQSPKSSRAQGG
jgi:hypothetical protein